jgi:hypothetical protein
MEKIAINYRALVSLITLMGFLIMGLTGIVLFFVPEGRIAYWTNWTFLGISKKQWGNIHILGSLVFAVAGIFHTYFNWKPLMGYIIDKVKGGIKRPWELSFTVGIALILIIGAVFELPPLNSILVFNAYVKESWIISKDYEPPFGHAEMLSLKGFSRKMNINLDVAVKAFKDSEISIKSVEDSLEKIALENNTSPMELYRIIKPLEPEDRVSSDIMYTSEIIEDRFAGSGIGQKRLTDVCEDLGIDIAVAEKRLAAKGIEIAEGEKLKDSAGRYDMNPLDLLKIIAVE